MSRIGNIYFEHQKFDGALEYYQRAAELHPEHEEYSRRYVLLRAFLRELDPSNSG